MNHSEFKKSKIFVLKDLPEYATNQVVTSSIIKKNTGNVNAISVAEGEHIAEKLSRFDHFVHITEGRAEIIIDEDSFQLEAGECIIIPANSKNNIIAHEKFKMISTIIKSGYE